MEIVNKIQFPMFVGYRLENNKYFLYDKGSKVIRYKGREAVWKGSQKELEETIRAIDDLEELV